MTGGVPMTTAPEGVKIISQFWPTNLNEDAYGRASASELKNAQTTTNGVEALSATLANLGEDVIQGLSGNAARAGFTQDTSGLTASATQHMNGAQGLALTSQNIFNTKTMLNGIADDYQAAWESLTAASMASGGAQPMIQAAKTALMTAATSASSIVGNAFQGAHQALSTNVISGGVATMPSSFVNSLTGAVSPTVPNQFSQMVTAPSASGPSGSAGGGAGSLISGLLGPQGAQAFDMIQQVANVGTGAASGAFNGPGGITEKLDEATAGLKAIQDGENSPMGRAGAAPGFAGGDGDRDNENVSWDDRDPEDDEDDDKDDDKPKKEEAEKPAPKPEPEPAPAAPAANEDTPAQGGPTTTESKDRLGGFDVRLGEGTLSGTAEFGTNGPFDGVQTDVTYTPETHTTAAGTAEAPTHTTGAAAAGGGGGGAGGGAMGGMGGMGMAPMGMMGGAMGGAMGAANGKPSGGPTADPNAAPVAAGGSLLDLMGQRSYDAEPVSEADAMLAAFPEATATGARLLGALTREFGDDQTPMAVAVYPRISGQAAILCTPEGVLPQGVRLPEHLVPLTALPGVGERFRVDWAGANDPATVLTFAARLGMIPQPEAVVTLAGDDAPLVAGVEALSRTTVSRITPAPLGDADMLPRVEVEHVAAILDEITLSWSVPQGFAAQQAYEALVARRWSGERDLEYLTAMVWWLCLDAREALAAGDTRRACENAWQLLALPLPTQG